MTEWAKVTLSQGNFSPVIKPKIYNIHEPSFDIRFVGVSKGKWTPGFGKINKLKNTFTFPVDVFERKKRAKFTPFYGTSFINCKGINPLLKVVGCGGQLPVAIFP